MSAIKRSFVGKIREKCRSVYLTAKCQYYRVTGRIPPPPKERVQFLYLHHVEDEHVPAFRQLVSMLNNEYRFISYTEAVERIITDRVDGQYVALSFDDGLRRTSLNAARVLKDDAISACFFVCPAVVACDDEAQLELFFSRINHGRTRVLDWSDVDTLLSWGHEIGSHTLSHRNLGKTTGEQTASEVLQAKDLLEKRIGVSPHFAWPYGRFRDISSDAARILRDADHASNASAERGCHVNGGIAREDLCIRRDHIHLDWPSEHIKLFLARNAVKKEYQQNVWPQEFIF